MSERKRQRVDEDARRLELCAEELRDLGASLGSCVFRAPSAHISVPLRASSSTSKPRNSPSPIAPFPPSSLFSVVSSASYAAKTSAQTHQDTWQTTLQRLGAEIAAKNASNESLERCERLERRFEAISESVKLFQEKVRRSGDTVAMQDRVESQLAEEETQWEQQMQKREQLVAEREVELKALQEEEEEQVEEIEEDEEEEVGELQEALALRAEEKRDIEAAIDSLQREKNRTNAEKSQRSEVVEVDASAAAREQVLRELREEKEQLQTDIIAAEELEEKTEENVRDLPALKYELAQAKMERTRVQTQVDSLRLELARRKRKMRHMVDVQLLTARDTNPPTLREEAVLLHLLYEHEGQMGVNELKQEASNVLEAHSKPNGNGVVIRALYSLVANGVVQIDRSYGNGLVTSMLV